MTEPMDVVDQSLPPEKRSAVKFGTFKGVFVPSILTIFGVIMYLRMGWVAGHAGLVGTVFIVSLSTGITLLTALSISSIATNMRIGAGGAYFMISRSFGLETGAAVGMPLFFAQALGVSFYAAGFAESLHHLFPAFPVQTIGFTAIAVLGIVAYVSADLAMKTQLLIMLVIGASIISIFLGKTPEFLNDAVAVTGGEATSPIAFWTIFAVFFPAVTGIEAGVAMSGNLRNPSRALPLGTLAAVVCGYVVYIALPLILLKNIPIEILRTDNAIIQKFALSSEVVIAGIWGATLSSALGALLGAPRTLQAMARDRLLPSFLGKGFGPSDEPRIATILTIAIALVGVGLGDLNVIAPVLSMFFLTSYGFINLATAVEGMIGSPTWRPTFRTSWVVSLVGAVGCIFAMLMIDAGATFVAGMLTGLIYWITKKRKLTRRWADLRRGILAMLARHALYKLDEYESEAARTWRPNILLLAGSPLSRWHLVELARSLTRSRGFLAISAMLPKEGVSAARLRSIETSLRKFLRKKKVSALVDIISTEDTLSASRNLIENFGMGPLIPNTIMMGLSEKPNGLRETAEIVLKANQERRNVLIVKDSSPPDPERRAVKHKGIIRVWWSRDYKQNANLMLAIAYLLHSTPQWRRCQIVLCSLVFSEAEREGALDFLEEFIASARMLARPEVFVVDEQGVLTAEITRHSAGAQLVLVGIRLDKKRGVEEFETYLSALTSSTSSLERILYVHAAQDLDFQEIFS